MRWLWWVFSAFYIGHVFPLLFLLTLRLPRNTQLIVQTVMSIGALYFSYEMSILLLVFTYVHAFIRTLDWTDRYAMASVLFLVADWLFPPATQPLAMVLFPFIFLIWQRNLYYRRDYKRMVTMLVLGLGIGLAVSLILRTIKELLFGNVIAWISHFFLWVGSWFDGIVLDPNDRVNRILVPDNPNIDAETVSQETLLETASNESLFFIGIFVVTLLIGVGLFFYLQKRKDIQEGGMIPKSIHHPTLSDKRIVRSPRQIQLLETGRKLEQLQPRLREETVSDWLQRIEFTDHTLYAEWLEAAEYGDKEAPKDVNESFERLVTQLKKR
ncbi:hypothetical protein ACFQO8_06550 [Exiguobacterium aestuarii]|uniref:DUF4129 domain-containing protein n=1 Tax=Exiguobacterium aestuarii TaxID=273527 RepID=A0ABW2PMV2_9BACL|nr:MULTISPECIES: hypothetical protein [Exiguobacterium]MCT4784843.1 hypothetical protein [Exiguobacterium aestuarii]